MIGWIMFGVSAAANILMVWYCRELIERHVVYVEKMEESLQRILQYKSHLKEVYGIMVTLRYMDS